MKSPLSASLTAINQPSSSNIEACLSLALYVRDDVEVLTSIDFIEDGIPIVLGLPTNTFRWHGEISYDSSSPFFRGGPSVYRPPILFLSHDTRLCDRLPTNGCFEIFR